MKNKWMVKVGFDDGKSYLLPAYGVFKRRTDCREFIREKYPKGCPTTYKWIKPVKVQVIYKEVK